MKEPTRYAEYAVPELGAKRVDAQWARISEQLPAPHAARRLSPVLLMVFGAACALAFVFYGEAYPRRAESVWEGSLVASDEAPVNLTLAEGTLIALDPRSEVSLMRSDAARVQVSVKRGSARFDVAKNRARRFSVQLGEVEVWVTGTQFHVARAAAGGGERVRVEVLEGSVEIHRQGLGAVALQAGDHWSAFVGKERAEGEPEVEVAPPLEHNAALEVDAALSAEVADAAPEAIASDEPASDEGETWHVERRVRARARAESAADLFEQANVARRAGRVKEAAELFSELASRHARDHRAALAAFELGRLRMDSLGDAAGAVEALERALKLDAGRAFAEDALARLVVAHDALGDRGACAKARARYLARYPEGVHAQHIALRCGGI